MCGGRSHNVCSILGHGMISKTHCLLRVHQNKKSSFFLTGSYGEPSSVLISLFYEFIVSFSPFTADVECRGGRGGGGGGGRGGGRSGGGRGSSRGRSYSGGSGIGWVKHFTTTFIYYYKEINSFCRNYTRY